jgi:tetratricopeptide (TPR) repeat protein
MHKDSGSTVSWDYLDFELEIREGESRGYAVAVHSPAGEAQEEMSFPFDERQLRDKLKDLEIALLRSGGTRRSLSTEERTVQEFGRRLFEAVLVGKVGTCYYRSMDQAQQEGKGLRLKLHVKPPNLTVLPWEFLYDPDRDEYLCFSRDTPIVRYTDLREPVGRLSVKPPLRILGMVASPRDLDPLDVEHEKGLMDEAIEDLQAGGLVKLTWLEGETWRDLQRAMRRDGPWHIFHFVGHGDFDLSAQEGLIAFTEKGTGRRHLLRSRDLARLLDGHPYLRLVFLNSCEGARGSEGDPFSGTAATLVRRGIPAVVAMQYQITDEAAIEFSSAFYESLADGLPVDAAVTEARVAVSMDSMLEWGTPVLYMRSPDGRLFDIATDTRPSEQPQGVTDQEELLEHEERRAREKELKERLNTLYAQARRSHQNQDWQAVIDVFEQIRAEDPAYPDSERLLTSAREALEAQELARRVTSIYAEGQRHMDAREWQQALECFEEVQRLESGFRETEELLSRVRRELAPPPKAVVPDLSGQAVYQANNTLASEGLRLRVQKELPSDTVPEGQIIGQSPGAGREVQSGTSVSVTVSSGFSTSKVPDLRGKHPDEARNILDAAGLRLGTVGKVPSDEVAENKIVKHYPTAGSKVKQGTSVRVTVADKQNEEFAVEEAPKRRSYPKPDTLPDESELEREVESSSQRSDKPSSDRRRKAERPQDLPE